MDQEKMVTFSKFAQAAARRMEEKKKLRSKKVRLKNLDGLELELRALSDQEIHDCTDFSDDAIETDKYTLYMASPTLREAAKIMVEQGSLAKTREYTITEMFTSIERRGLIDIVLELSGATGDAGIEMIEEQAEIKNFSAGPAARG